MLNTYFECLKSSQKSSEESSEDIASRTIKLTPHFGYIYLRKVAHVEVGVTEPWQRKRVGVANLALELRTP